MCTRDAFNSLQQNTRSSEFQVMPMSSVLPAAPLHGALAWDEASRSVHFTPAQPLLPATHYQVGGKRCVSFSLSFFLSFSVS